MIYTVLCCVLFFYGWLDCVDSTHIPEVSDLSLEEKIGQLIMMATVSSVERNEQFMQKSPYMLDPSYAIEMVQKHHIGGIIFLGAGSPDEQYMQTRLLQSVSRYPLLIGLDAEWGLSMRHQKDVVHFPRAMTLGALSQYNEYLIYNMGVEIGNQCRQLGVHINFAPVVDVNSNAANPIINTRSFGDDPDIVARKAMLYMCGMQASGLLSCAKHFPGHGDTAFDTHHTYGIVPHSRERLDEIELFPFKHMIKHNVDAIMTAHLAAPALSHEKNVPATMSYDIITKLLRDELKFDGLVITDGLGMGALMQQYTPAEIAVNALKAGVDILLCPVDIPETVGAIKNAVESGDIPKEILDEHVQRVLSAKKKVMSQEPHSTYSTGSLITEVAQELKNGLYQAAVTCVPDEQSLVPISKNKKIVLYTFGDAIHIVAALRSHVEIEHHALSLDELRDFSIKHTVDENTQVIISLHMPGRSGMIELQHEQKNTADYVMFDGKKMPQDSILVLFGSPYNLKYIVDMPVVILGYENEPEAQEAVAQVLLDLQGAEGRLPVTLK